ncbi:MAG TPA: hypothetical protein PKD78_11740, partial [Saprospiraceae bacterium]|nr:hypothetical protein [Saprospiraceae bacterium]
MAHTLRPAALLASIWLLQPIPCAAQAADTLPGYHQKVQGEEITYFSPMKQFADRALLTRCTGDMPVRWRSEPYAGRADSVCYEWLIGHSTGTSKGVRTFRLRLNNTHEWLIETRPKEKGHLMRSGKGPAGRWAFASQEYDINGDVFGRLCLTLPAQLAAEAPQWELSGLDQQSRDWMMVFMYRRDFRAEAHAGQLLLRNSTERQLRLFVENPFSTEKNLSVQWENHTRQYTLQPGFNSLALPAFDKDANRKSTLHLRLEGYPKPLAVEVALQPIRHRTFHIIHHSHNDIGYSHHQTEVERIQSENIRAAMRWAASSRDSLYPPRWHIESLWAVENFLRLASPDEQQKFMALVRSGHIVLSANYANILTGLCRPEEQRWALEYAQALQSKYQLPISMVMTTDIPGLSASALAAYSQSGYPYLSLGPNYVKNLPDRGDRIGAMLEAQGDQVFWWAPDTASSTRLMVWTAGRGYSMFHNIADRDQQHQWEQRLSEYMRELDQRGYPYEDIQLRYTKHADNGPVDTLLSEFVRHWNERYESPRLEIGSIPQLFAALAAKHGKDFPTRYGELSPYWEDGAYSTAQEEIAARQLVSKTLQLEKTL